MLVRRLRISSLRLRLPRPFHPVALTTLISLIGLFGASGGGASSADPADSTDQPSDPIPREAVAAADPIPGSEESTVEATTLAVAEHEVAGVEVDLLDVSRIGDAITVRWQYRTELENGVTLSDGDGDGNDNDPYALTRGAYLFDEAHQKKYLVLEDDAGRPVAAEHTHGH